MRLNVLLSPKTTNNSLTMSIKLDIFVIFVFTDCDDCLFYKGEQFSYIYFNAEGFIRSPEFPQNYPSNQ